MLDLSFPVSVELGLVRALTSEAKGIETLFDRLSEFRGPMNNGFTLSYLVAHHGGVSKNAVRLQQAGVLGLANENVATLHKIPG